MSEKRLKRKIIKKKLFTKNRLVILNEDTFEEVFSLRLTLMNVFVVATIGALLIIFVTTYIIAFTPLREFIPGYASTQLKKEATELALKSDSLLNSFKKNETYIQSIKKVLMNDLEYAKFNKDSITASSHEPANENDLKPTKADLKLRAEVAREDKYAAIETVKPKARTVLLAPVQGMITKKFNPKNNHYAVDISYLKNTSIKAILNGIVIFADWTPTTKNVIIIRHSNGFISVYKNMASILVSLNDIVKKGEVIALAGSQEKQLKKTHLHFELYKDGYSVDPSIYIKF